MWKHIRGFLSDSDAFPVFSCLSSVAALTWLGLQWFKPLIRLCFGKLNQPNQSLLEYISKI